jgi:hypothetical protein
VYNVLVQRSNFFLFISLFYFYFYFFIFKKFLYNLYILCKGVNPRVWRETNRSRGNHPPTTRFFRPHGGEKTVHSSLSRLVRVYRESYRFVEVAHIYRGSSRFVRVYRGRVQCTCTEVFFYFFTFYYFYYFYFKKFLYILCILYKGGNPRVWRDTCRSRRNHPPDHPGSSGRMGRKNVHSRSSRFARGHQGSFEVIEVRMSLSRLV